MNSEDIGCVLLIILALLVVIACVVFHYNKKEYQRGYVQCLVDIKSGKKPQYILVNHPDGTTAWKEVEK